MNSKQENKNTLLMLAGCWLLGANCCLLLAGYCLLVAAWWLPVCSLLVSCWLLTVCWLPQLLASYLLAACWQLACWPLIDRLPAAHCLLAGFLLFACWLLACCFRFCCSMLGRIDHPRTCRCSFTWLLYSCCVLALVRLPHVLLLLIKIKYLWKTQARSQDFSCVLNTMSN